MFVISLFFSTHNSHFLYFMIIVCFFGISMPFYQFFSLSFSWAFSYDHTSYSCFWNKFFCNQHSLPLIFSFSLILFHFLLPLPLSLSLSLSLYLLLLYLLSSNIVCMSSHKQTSKQTKRPSLKHKGEKVETRNAFTVIHGHLFTFWLCFTQK